MVSLITILSWFKTGLKPTQDHFAQSFSSFRHKNDKVPVAEVDGIDDFFSSKADAEAFQNHIEDEDLHGGGNQFTETIANKLRALVFVQATASLLPDVTTFEKGVPTDIEFAWSVTPNEDTITDVVFDGNTGSGNSGSETFNTTIGITKTLVVKRASGADITRTATADDRYYRYVYFGARNTHPTTSAGVRALTNKSFLNESNTASFSLSVPANTSEVVVFTVAGKTVTVANPATNEDLTVTQSNIIVKDGGAVDVDYTKNIIDLGLNGFPTASNFNITIN